MTIGTRCGNDIWNTNLRKKIVNRKLNENKLSIQFTISFSLTFKKKAKYI